MARQANVDPLPPEDVMESIAVRSALAAHASNLAQSLPENMFAPFAIHHPQATLTHWANVDTGSMVNIMYEGAVTAFPYLAKFW